MGFVDGFVMSSASVGLLTRLLRDSQVHDTCSVVPGCLFTCCSLGALIEQRGDHPLAFLLILLHLWSQWHLGSSIKSPPHDCVSVRLLNMQKEGWLLDPLLSLSLCIFRLSVTGRLPEEAWSSSSGHLASMLGHRRQSSKLMSFALPCISVFEVVETCFS